MGTEHVGGWFYPGEHGFRYRTPRSSRTRSTAPSTRSCAPAAASRSSASTSRPVTSRPPSTNWSAGSGGRARRRAARRDRHRQVGHHGLADRAAAAAHPGDGAEQDARRPAGERAARDVAAQRRRVLRLVLRLLPARGVHRADRHLHREGQLDQRRRRAAAALGDVESAVPPRRGGGGVGVVHLRPGHPAVLPGPLGRAAGRQEVPRDALLRLLVDVQYTRNDMAFTRGSFRVRGDTVEIIPAYEELAVRIEFFGDEIEELYYLHPLTGDVVREVDSLRIFPATHYVAGPERMAHAISTIEQELAERLAELERQGKLLEAQRLRMRTNYDVEMMRQVGFCSGIENYSRHIDGRPAGSAAGDAARLLPGGLPDRHRRVARDRAADRRHVRRRHVPQAQPRRLRVPAAVGGRQPAADLGGVRRPGRADGVPVGDPGTLRAEPGRRRVRRAGDPPDRPGRPGGGGQADQGADRRPDRRDPQARRARRARAGHHADQEDGRGPHRLPARDGHPGPLPALGGRHAAPGRAAAPAAARRLRRARRHQPAARGSGPAGGVAGGDPRRRQGRASCGRRAA